MNDQRRLKICLLGSIPKGDEIRESWKDWKKEYVDKISTIPDTEFTDGDTWKDEARPFELVGHDANLVKTADVIVVNAEVKLGAGTAQEMVIAKYFSRPVISVLPKDTHHRRSNVVFDGKKMDEWIHPFVLTFSDAVVENIDECVEWIKRLKNSTVQTKIKNISIVDEAIAAYQKAQGENFQ